MTRPATSLVLTGTYGYTTHGGVHLLNAGHAAAAEFLCQELVPIISGLRPARSGS